MQKYVRCSVCHEPFTEDEWSVRHSDFDGEDCHIDCCPVCAEGDSHEELEDIMSLRDRLYFLHHPETEGVYAGYGLALDPEDPSLLVGILLVDRPHRVDDAWLEKIGKTFGQYDLYVMAQDGSRGIGCIMQIDTGSTKHLVQYHTKVTAEIAQVLSPLLAVRPKPMFVLQWDDTKRLWISSFATVVPPRFRLGQLVATPGALSELEQAGKTPIEFVKRHVTGDWGDLDDEDKRSNEAAVVQDARILSRYLLNSGIPIWIITEWDRSVTTILLPEEY